MSRYYPDDVDPNDPSAPWNDEPERTRWEPVWKNTCIECDEYRPCDENGFCKKCFEPQEIEKETDRDDAD